eukprot:6193423-Pleurochrysis_carterae.AAC.1
MRACMRASARECVDANKRVCAGARERMSCTCMLSALHACRTHACACDRANAIVCVRACAWLAYAMHLGELPPRLGHEAAGVVKLEPLAARLRATKTGCRHCGMWRLRWWT